MTRRAIWLTVPLAIIAIALGGCGGDDGIPYVQQDTSSGTDGGGNTSDTNVGGEDGGGGTCQGSAPAGYATLRFWVDDSARRTFSDGEMIWTGSFAHDRDSNIITYASSWLPTDGPFPLLSDDGPRADCGTERPDGVAGDHVFTTEVYYLADEDRTFEYGLLNEDSNWMWDRANGMVDVPAGSTEVYDLEGMVIPPCGDADIKIALDLNALYESYAGLITPDTHDVYIKGSMNMWTDVQLVDNGKRGDDAADDGIYTFVFSENLGKHDCLLLEGDKPQFVFSFAFTEAEPDQEYKADLPNPDDPDGPPAETALSAGVTVWVASPADATWQSAEIAMEWSSDGRRLNTAVPVPGAAPRCDSDTDCSGDRAHCIVGYCVTCFENDHCGAGLVCEKNHCVEDQGGGGCVSDAECDGTWVCEGGQCVECRDAGQCSDGEVCQSFACVTSSIETCTDDGDCDDGVCVNGRCEECRDDSQCGNGYCYAASCVDCLDDEHCGEDEACLAGECVTTLGPRLYQIVPDRGSMNGGTAVTLKGVNFADGITILFDGVPATNVQVVSASEVTCTTPPASGPARVDVSVESADGLTDIFFAGYDYYDDSDAPRIDRLEPNNGTTDGGESVHIYGGNFQDGAIVSFGGTVASAYFVDGGHLIATAPAAQAGAVDVTVTNPSTLSATCSGCYTYAVYELWEDEYIIATNELASDWGDENHLEALHVFADGTTLHVGVVGSTGVDNAIVLYIDTDPGAGTGVGGADGGEGCWDNSDAAENALCVDMGESSSEGADGLTFTADGFMADVAFAVIGMAGYSDPDCTSLGDSHSSGWRDFRIEDMADLGWICGDVMGRPGIGRVDARIALSELYARGASSGSSISLVARIVNGAGNYTSNQSLPGLSEGASGAEVSAVATFTLP